MLRYGKHRALAQIDRALQPQNAYPSHVGSAERLLFRYNYDYKDIFQTGFVFEKDAGEKSLTDFWSFHVFIKNLRFVEALSLGDYKVSFGQGLTIGNGLAFTTTGSSLMRRNALSTKTLRATIQLRYSPNNGNYTKMPSTGSGVWHQSACRICRACKSCPESTQ